MKDHVTRHGQNCSHWTKAADNSKAKNTNHDLGDVREVLNQGERISKNLPCKVEVV